MVPDSQLTRVELVADRPVCSLVDETLAQGPGIREMTQLVALAESSLGQARNSCKQLPGIDPCAGGACCFSFLSPFQTCEQLRVAQSRLKQVRLSYEDLRGKLTAGVRQSYAVISAGREQLPLLEQTIDLAREAFTLTRSRFTEHLSDTNATQVSMTLDSLEDAHRSYVETTNNYNKAQLQLLLLLGYPACPTDGVTDRGPIKARLPVASTEGPARDTTPEK
jgi:outer membrane protein TolC